MAVDIRGLTKRFGTRAVFECLDLTIPAGQAVAVIGANGTGKSTLMRCLIRLAEPDAGSIMALGASVTTLDRRGLRAFRSKVGFVFQKHNLVGRLSALTNVIHGVQSRQSGPRTWFQALAPAAVRREAMDCLDRVGLGDRALQPVQSLSGGQSQRVAVARMLMQRPELIIADEPDASLDPKAGAEVMALLFRIGRERGVTLVFVSHHMEHAVRFADRIVGLEGGAVALDIPAQQIDPERLKRFFETDPARGEQPALSPGQGAAIAVETLA
jgi:phosphonate transport system ATP-binding protein